MTDLESLSELVEDCGLDATVEIASTKGDRAVLLKPASQTSQQIVFSLLESLCREISFTVPSIRYAIVDFGGEHRTIIDCSHYQK